MIAAIFVGSIINIPIEVKQIVLQDKVMHVTAYGCLMGWFAQIYRHDLTRLILVITFVAMGILIEILQSMTPTRQFEWLDMVANTSGVVLAWALAYTWFGGLLVKFERLVGVKHSV
ncbi:MAG: VanZ family protein [Granulosicoccaceae bacterium]